MELKGKKILLISPERWGINYVSKHHYAIELAKNGSHVYFLNPPSIKQSIKKEDKNLYIVNYKTKFRGLSKFPSLLSGWLIKRTVISLEKYCATKFDIIWNFDSSSFFNLAFLDSKLRITHIVDYSENKNGKLLNKTADLCLCTTDYILERQKKYNSNAYKIGHGYALEDNPDAFLLPMTKAPIKVGYLGNLLIKYLSWELILDLVVKNSALSFFFAGPYTKSNLSQDRQMPKFLLETMKQKNTYFIGSLKPTQIHSFLTQMDVLLLAYKANKHKEQLANPHKILEYLASGKVIIASWTEEFVNETDLLAMVEDNNQYREKFNEVTNNLAKWNNDEVMHNRKVFALNNTYKNQIHKIEGLLNNNVN